jgi:hypothetical protein
LKEQCLVFLAILNPIPTDPLANITLDLSTVNMTTYQDQADESRDLVDYFMCMLAQQVKGAAPSELMNIKSDDPDDNSTRTINPPGNIGDTTIPTIPGLDLSKAFHPKIALSVTVDKAYLAWWIHW